MPLGGLGEVVEYMMAKDRHQRYRSAEDLILDLECLLNGQPPKLARDRIGTGTLAALAGGDTEEDEEEKINSEASQRHSQGVWIVVLAILLGASLLVNLIFLVKR